MPAPTGVKAEIESIVTPGVFTDVTADVDYNTGWTIHIGRASGSGTIQPGSATITLRNPTGKYTPGVQVLSDGTAAPYYPNIVPRRRLRLSNSSGVRFVGYIKSWTPGTNGFTGSSYCTVVAQDRLDVLSRVILPDYMQQAVLSTSPAGYWPLNDGSAAATAASLVTGIPAMSPVQISSGGNAVFGTAMGGSTVLTTGLQFTPVDSTHGIYYSALLNTAATGSITLEFYVQTTASNFTFAEVIGSSNGSNFILCDASGFVQCNISGVPGASSTAKINDGALHHVALAISLGGLGGNFILYMDGALVANNSTASVFTAAPVTEVRTWGVTGGGLGAFTMSNLVLYLAQRSGAQIAADYAYRLGGTGDTVNTRLAFWLTYAGLTAPDYNLDTSMVTIGTYPQNGKDVVSACQDMTTTEGGGSSFYVLAGVVQFRNRRVRDPAAATLTITAGADDDRSGYTPTEDDAQLVNQVTVNRATASANQSSQIASDATSITTYGLTTQDVTTYTQTDADALALAQSIVAAGRTPQWRLPQIKVDLLTSPNNLYAAVQATGIGSKITVQTLPSGQAPATTVNVRVEGWTETVKFDTYSIMFDTSADDNPARALASDANYGSAQCDGQTLNASLTNSATTVVIATSGGKATFTTNAGMYPLKIMVGAERMTLNSAPGGATTPQTFTGISRGVDGTTASAQSSGATVTIWPRVTATL